jgi:hypothetical protein
MVSGAAAQYDAGAHTLWFPRDSYGADAEERALTLHECSAANGIARGLKDKDGGTRRRRRLCRFEGEDRP